VLPTDLVSLARQVVETYIRTEQTFVPPPELLPEFRQRQAGVFVTLTAHHDLRGCIGTIGPTQAHIIDETIANAISAATRDPRFPPVTAPELADLVYEVSVLHAPEPIQGLHQLDPNRYGVIVTASQGRRGLLLPGLEQITEAETQVLHAMHKGGIRPGEAIQLYRFQVDKYPESTALKKA
jgi:AmmeMemoRadiSam system protein A